MSITIKDISKQVGVSYSTVAKALNNSPLVKETTKRKVIAAAESLGYRPNLAARSLVTKRTGLIGIVWPNVERPALSSLLTSIQKRLADNQLTALLSIDDAQQAITTFLNLRVDAILMFEESANGIADGQAHNIVPFVSIGTPVRSDVPAVDMNRREAIKLAVSTLHAKGHTRIAYIGPYAEASVQQREKWIGYREGLHEGGLSFEEELLIDSHDVLWQHGYNAAQQLIAMSDRPTAVIAGSYDLAAGVLRAFQTNGISVPHDIAIISYDHIPHLEQLEIPISAVGVPENVLSDAIAQTVLQVIEAPGSTPNRMPLIPEYIHRLSD